MITKLKVRRLNAKQASAQIECECNGRVLQQKLNIKQVLLTSYKERDGPVISTLNTPAEIDPTVGEVDLKQVS